MEKCIENFKKNRFVIARKENDFNNTIVVQISYISNFGLFDMRNILEIKSVDGLSVFEIITIKYKSKKIYFLKGKSNYFVDLSVSLFDFFK